MNKAPSLLYDEARKLIQSGDIISFVPHGSNPLHVITQLVTKSEYYHTGVATWLYTSNGNQRLFVCEAHRSGRRLVPLSIYRGTQFDVTRCPVSFDLMEDRLLAKVGQVKYGFRDFVGIGFRELFGLVIKDEKGEICSEMVQDALWIAGMKIPEDTVMSPGELYRYLKGMGMEDRVKVIG